MRGDGDGGGDVDGDGGGGGGGGGVGGGQQQYQERYQRASVLATRGSLVGPPWQKRENGEVIILFIFYTSPATCLSLRIECFLLVLQF